jgi:5-methylcytosine-specific restriction endonuclease McrA
MARKKKIKKFAYKGKLMSAARRIWLYSPMRKEALNRDKTPDGFHRCQGCKRLSEEVAIDHEPSVVPLTGWDSWDNVLERLFCPAEQLHKLCHHCHSKKTAHEASSRKENRAKKNIKKDE